jgi:hypothetical protein
MKVYLFARRSFSVGDKILKRRGIYKVSHLVELFDVITGMPVHLQ